MLDKIILTSAWLIAITGIVENMREWTISPLITIPLGILVVGGLFLWLIRMWYTLSLFSRLLKTLEKVEKMVSTNLGRQNEKLYDVLPIIRDTINSVKGGRHG